VDADEGKYSVPVLRQFRFPRAQACALVRILNDELRGCICCGLFDGGSGVLVDVAVANDSEAQTAHERALTRCLRTGELRLPNMYGDWRSSG
jgi:hypothetical protein